MRLMRYPVIKWFVPSLLLPSLLVALAVADEPAAKPSIAPGSQEYAERVAPFFAKYCQECHSGEEPKGDLRLDLLTPDFLDAQSRDHWLTVVEQLREGRMPPKEKPRPPEKEARALLDWICSSVESANAARRATQGRVVLRRLNRTEYENTVRDLLGIEIELKELLPQDTSAHGFDNIGDALHTSSFLMDCYLDAAEAALNKAIVNFPQPPLVKKRYTLKEERLVQTTTENVYLHRDDAVVLFSSSPWNAITLGQFYPPDRGRYRIQISAFGYQSAGKPASFRIDSGPMLMGTKNHLVGYFDAAADKPTVTEFIDYFEARNHIRIFPYGLANAQTVTKLGADKYEGAGLAVQWVDVEGPLYDIWPPESHRRIFGELPQEGVPTYNNSGRIEVVSANPAADAERILRGFVGRAYRRSVTDEDIQPFLVLVQKRLEEKYRFEQAIRVGLMAVMVSPEFLFLREGPGQLDDFSLASRLSYFLWSTMPDQELLALAEAGKLHEPSALRRQVERMLKHPKAKALTENFVGQWLGLRDIDFTEPSHILYPEFDDMLKASMLKETELFFAEILKDDLSLTNFVAADFSMLNGRLAKHYGIPGVEGWEFHKIPLPPESHRGGMLTMASVLKVTANGTSTSPVMRGAWVLDRILGTPPSPPPENVSALEPDTRGATTIREQLAKHREIESCASCHAQIDPPGFALESFDVIGGYREHYRTSGNGKEVFLEGRRMPYQQGLKIDPTGVLTDGREFGSIDEFKQLLLADKDQIARSLTTKLVTYATGGAPESIDRAEVEAIVGKIREKDYGFRSLIHEIVRSELFQKK